MAISVDFEHSEQVANAILDRLEANLPATWLDKLNPTMGLKRIEFGRFATWRFSGKDGDRDEGDLIPSILLRFATNVEQPDINAVGGAWGRAIPYTAVYLFGEEQCYDLTAPYRPIQPERAKAQRAKTISKAIWDDATDDEKLRLGNPTLTTTDTEAHIITSIPGPILYSVEEDAGPLGLHAVGVQLTVLTFTK